MAGGLSDYLAALERDLCSLLSSEDEAVAPLYQMMRYHLGWLDQHFRPTDRPRGKCLRPLMCLLSCQAVGGDWRRALPAASAIELVHGFSLIHDDIEDKSDTRRHRPTVWHLWGVAQAINTGDAMWALSRLSLARLSGWGYDSCTVLRVGELLAQTCLALCTGQYLDLAFEVRQAVSMADYERMILGKTAALFSASPVAGAILGGAGEPVVSAYRDFGRELGLSFQITDDILGIWGDPVITGKSAASDLLEKKKTFPVLYALHWEQKRGHNDLGPIYARPTISSGDLSIILALLDRCGAREYARSRAWQHQQRALGYLDAALVRDAGHQADAAHDELRKLAMRLVNRAF